WRPGLEAARDHGVRHPYVEAGIDKAGVRAIARRLGLGDVAEQPASPCLSSRVETGIAIDPGELATIHAVETLVAHRLSPPTVRCRLRRAGWIVELDAGTLDALDAHARMTLAADIANATGAAVSFAPYRMGSAFLRPAVVAHG
ncbi:MAG: adenine nucleotide alpha hydrolase, partial [Alphaproteobacteria bacterium]